MKNITNSTEITRSTNGGATLYGCPWGDYYSTSFFKAWKHAVVHALMYSISDMSNRMIRRFPL